MRPLPSHLIDSHTLIQSIIIESRFGSALSQQLEGQLRRAQSLSSSYVLIGVRAQEGPGPGLVGLGESAEQRGTGELEVRGAGR